MQPTMTARTTNLSAEQPYDALRAAAVRNPTAAGAYGRLLGQHYGAFPVERLRPMLRWVRVLAGETATARKLDGLFRRIEGARAAWSWRTAADQAPRHTVEVGGRRLHFLTDDPASNRFIQVNLIGQWPYEPGVTGYLLERLRPDDVFVDVGAHAGFFSLIACSRGAVAYAIEPQRDMVRVIERNAVINHADRLHVLNLGASNHEALVSMIRFGGSPGMQLHGELMQSTSATPQNRHVDWIATARLDTLFGAPVLRPEVVKIDVEGLELRVLAGAAGLIAGNRTIFVVELHPHLIAGCGGRLETLAELFGSPAWRVVDLSDRRPSPITLADGIARAAAGAASEDGRVTLAFEPASLPPLPTA